MIMKHMPDAQSRDRGADLLLTHGGMISFGNRNEADEAAPGDPQASLIDPSIEGRDPGRIALSTMSFQLLPRTRRVSMVGPTGSP